LSGLLVFLEVKPAKTLMELLSYFSSLLMISSLYQILGAYFYQ